MYKVTKRHGQREVLKNISLSYFYGAKIGVLGLNGSGKSSLLRILAGVDTEFDGEIQVKDGYSIGYLEQEPLVNEERTVREVVEEGVGEVMDIIREYNEINEKFAEPMEPEEMDALIERQGKVQELMDAKGAWTLIPSLKWPWIPCVVRLRIHLFPSFPVVKAPRGIVPSAVAVT